MSESTESDEAVKKSLEVEKGQNSSRFISKDLKNHFSSTIVAITPVKKKMFSIVSL